MKRILLLLFALFTLFQCHSQISLTVLRLDGVDDYVQIPFPSAFYSVVGTPVYSRSPD